MLYDISIIGAGIIGASIARELSKYNLTICLIEKENDVSCGVSKSNSGIIHAGFDPVSGTLMSKLNVQGAPMYEQLAKNLNFDYKKNGAVVLGFSQKDMELIHNLYKRGTENNVKNLQVLSKNELHELENNVNPAAIGALLAETSGIVSPYQATWAITENAVDNGVQLFLENKVTTINKENDIFHITTDKQVISSKCIINVAGLFSDKISKMAGARNFTIKPRLGEYFLLDNKMGNIISHTIFQTPDEKGKGILVTPTVDGNILAGPTAIDVENKENTEISYVGQEEVLRKAKKSIPEITTKNVINSFSGLRAIPYDENGKKINDFIIEEDVKVPGFINVAGICSPGLSSSPAIGIYVSEIVNKIFGGKLKLKSHFIDQRKGIPSFMTLSLKDKEKLIESNNQFGRIICRCEMITEGEIVNTIHSTIGAKDLDGVKRRTRSGMGRCQGGFCSPRIVEILSRELDCEMTAITKKGGKSFMLDSKIR